MADEKPIQNAPEDESKKDTVRINLPQQGGPKPAGPSPTPTVRLKPMTPPSAPSAPVPPSSPMSDDESKKETAVMGMPAATPKPKKDTSRVQVPAAKPSVPEMPRPTVKLKREEPPAAPAAAPASSTSSGTYATPATPPTAPPPSKAAAPVVVSGTSGIDVGLAIAAMIVAISVAGYLFSLNNGQ